jgi:regulator of nucleoside diphosphate kinase
MRAIHDFHSPDAEARPIVLDAAYAARLQALASSNLYGRARLARLLRREADRIEVVPSEEMPAAVVNFGSEVTYRDEATGDVCTIVLALPHEADIPARRVSVLSPVGTALVGRSVGAVVACEFPAGRVRPLTVLRVAEPAPTGAGPRQRLGQTRSPARPASDMPA